MKAEHRKELETNTLADKMGTMVKRVKTGNRNALLIYAGVGAVLVVGLWIAYASISTSRLESSDRWLRLDDGSRKNLVDLADKEGEHAAGKAARIQMAWFNFWEGGIKRTGAVPMEGTLFLAGSAKEFEQLMKVCKDDETFEPEVMLGFAVVQETRAMQDKEFLDKAVAAYKSLIEIDKYKDTAQVKFAKGRVEQLTDKTSRAEIESIYAEMRRGLDIGAPMPKLPKGHPLFGQ